MNVDSVSTVDILIVTALVEEARALDDLFDFDLQPVFFTSSIPYYINQNISCRSSANPYSVATFCLNAMGNTNAGIDVSQALRDLNPTYVFMFGIAGGIKGEVSLADVIVPDKIFYNALGKLSQDGHEVRPEPLRTDTVLLQRLHAYAAFQVSADKEYKVKIGPLAVGEQVVANSDGIAELQKIHPKMIGIEMESYGVGLAVFKYRPDVSFVAVRGVSDYADEQKNDDHRGIALKNAADFLIGFIRSGLLPRRSSSSGQIPKLIAIHHLSLYRRPSVHQAIQSYLKRLQQFDVIELPIDQIDLFRSGSLIDPAEALRRQEEMLARLDEILQENPKCELGYFGLAHIPLVFHMGYKINRREVQMFGNDYNSGDWIDLPERSTQHTVTVEGLPEQGMEQSGDVLMLMSVSYTIASPEPDDVVNHPLARIHIRVEDPQLGLIDSQEVLNKFTKLFRDTLHRFSHVHRVHLFYAGPPTLAFRCGQQINPNIDPEIIVYNYSRRDHPNYRWALNLQTGEVVERR